MVLKYLVPLLAISSVYGQRLGSDPKTWSPKLSCDRCVSLLRTSETSLVSSTCVGVTQEEKIVCKYLAQRSLKMLTPETLCRGLGYCPNK